MLKEFKEFAMRGSFVDMAVGIVIGAAFGKIVSSFVTDIFMPPLGLILGHMDFSSYFLNLSGKPVTSLAAAKAAGAATLNYGLFINNIIDFLIVAFAMFMVVRQINRMMPAPPARGGHQRLSLLRVDDSNQGRPLSQLHLGAPEGGVRFHCVPYPPCAGSGAEFLCSVGALTKRCAKGWVH